MENLSKITCELRKHIFRTAYLANTGHIAPSLSMVEIMAVLYFGGVLKYNATDPKWQDRDRLIMSKGHASLVLYSTLMMAGYFEEKKLDTFCKPDSHLGGLLKMNEELGIEATTGSLGHGLPFGTGIALANKLDRKDSKVYVVVGDGECQEGSIWEAAMNAAHYNLNNLVVIIDHNRLQAMDKIEEIVKIDSLAEKWESFGWNTVEIDGHNISEIYRELTANYTDKPKVIIANTIKGKGISFMENVPIWHYRIPNRVETEIAIAELGLSRQEVGLE